MSLYVRARARAQPREIAAHRYSNISNQNDIFNTWIVRIKQHLPSVTPA